jgi:hypothetical protein
VIEGFGGVDERPEGILGAPAPASLEPGGRRVAPAGVLGLLLADEGGVFVEVVGPRDVVGRAARARRRRDAGLRETGREAWTEAIRVAL